MKIIFHILVFLFATSSLAQDFTQEQLENMKDEELLELFMEVELDSIKAEKVARTYLNRARKERDTIKMARGYDRLARIFHPEKNIAFADSVIELTKNIKNITYPALGYMIKAYEFSGRDLIYETKNNLIAFDLAKKNGNIMQLLYITDRLITAKSIWGNKAEALELQLYRNSLINNKTYLDDITKSTRPGARNQVNELKMENELFSLQNFAICYLNLKRFDSTYYYVNKGMSKSKGFSGFTQNEGFHYNAFMEILIELDFYCKNYLKVIQNCDTLIPKINTEVYPENLLNLYLFKGLSYLRLNENRKGIMYLKKSDSIYDSRDMHILPHQRILFEELHKYYESKNNSEKQIVYLNKLLFTDSVFKRYYQYFEPDLIKNLDTPRILEEKEALIDRLENKNELSTKQIWWVLGLFGLSSFLLIYYVVLQRRYRKRFLDLVASQQNKSSDTTGNTIKNKLSSTVIENILNDLDNFEEKNEFLKKDISLRSLSKSLGTNPRYLSKVINLEKEKNFVQYITDLRLDYAVKALITNEKLRKYTIKAIAGEFGFNTSESFSKAFYKKHGIYPSYFLSRLEKNQEKEVKNVLKTILKKSPS